MIYRAIHCQHSCDICEPKPKPPKKRNWWVPVALSLVSATMLMALARLHQLVRRNNDELLASLPCCRPDRHHDEWVVQIKPGYKAVGGKWENVPLPDLAGPLVLIPYDHGVIDFRLESSEKAVGQCQK